MILRAKDLDMKMNDLSSIKGHKEMKDLMMHRSARNA